MAGLAIRAALCVVCLAVEISGASSRHEAVEPPTVQETTVAEMAPQGVEQTTESVTSDYSRGFRHYRVNGVTPPYEWEWYLYAKLADRGLEWFYPVAVAQIYQESNWNQWANNGRDRGLCQHKAIYWDSRAAQAGIPGADIWSPYAQIHVYVWMMAQYIEAAGWSVEGALSIYFLGHAGYAAEYVGHVMRWLDYLEVVP